ncbi:molybdate ABC transporter substrate-binding protein [uncultured Roseobacter sp.]|uniref:molybdate ABC transporter substrate-binding protein n=1 Tax=uncultured Roseobacter sp. TaxID=114847 RepID=UPI0026055B58|nr:molybdate ABC transporter substrate-binding protein [uncultured Roseobacter sp.]
MMRFLLICALCLLAFGLAPARADQITVFAAASLKTALDEITAGFIEEKDYSVSLSYAGSSLLARQISQGAPANVFISANRAWMDWLEAQQALAPETRGEFIGNRLVLIAHGAEAAPLTLTRETLADRLGAARIATALVEAVPAGIYAKAALSHFELWDALSPQIVQTDNARTALALVAAGEAPFGIVYATDAQAEPRVSVLALFPPESHPVIRYPAALLEGRASPAAQAFLNHLTTAPARRVFENQGFTLLRAAP